QQVAELFDIIKTHNDSLISFVKNYPNIYYLTATHPVFIIYEILIVLLAIACFIYGIYILIEVIKRRDAAYILQLIIIFTGLLGLFTIGLLYSIDPFHTRVVMTYSTYSFFS